MAQDCTAKVTSASENPERRDNASENGNFPLIHGYTPGASTLFIVLNVKYKCIGKCPDAAAEGGFSPCPLGSSVDLGQDIPISDLVSDKQLAALDSAHKAYKSDGNSTHNQGTTHTNTPSQKLLESLYTGALADKIDKDIEGKGSIFQGLDTELADWNLCKCKITKTVLEKSKMSGVDQNNKNRAYKRNRY
tara:strand:- start:8 stop:580 length:573 start_codon:yes stop_codon:yes gene_type:complete